MCISQKKELMIMRYTITGRNIEVTPGLKAAVEKKIGKLEHFFTPDTEVIVALSAQKDQQKIEVTIPVKGNTIRAEESSTDMYVSIDLVEEIIERQILQMEMLGHNFFVFLNSETEQVNVVYKRKNGTYGLIEPEF